MGLSGFFQALKAKGFDYAVADLSSIEQQAVIDIDLFGTPWFRNLLLSKLVEPITPDAAGRQLGALIRSLFGTQTLRVHIDGGRNQEKEFARAKRAEDFSTNIEQIDKALTKMRQRADQGRFVNGTVIRTIESKMKQVYVLTNQEKQALCNGLSSMVEVCSCRTEADLCIARSKRHGSLPRIVVSGDSDMVGYSTITRFLRNIPRTSYFAWCNRADVLSALDLPSPRHLTLLAIISRNDYGKNIEGLGYVKNCELLRTIPQGPVDAMLAQYIVQAGRKVGRTTIERDRFEPAFQIFYRLRDTPLPYTPDNTAFLTWRQTFQSVKDIRFQNAVQNRAVRTGPPPFYVAPGSKPNQFRHVFTSKDTILKRRKEVDLNNVRQFTRPAPVPSRVPATKRGKRAKRTKKKRQRYAKKKKSDEPTEKRNLRSATRTDHSLRKNHIVKTLTVGSIKCNLDRTGTVTKDEAKTIADTLRESVMILNRIQLAAFELLALDITTILAPTAADAGPSTPTQPKNLSKADLSDLDDILQDNNFYFTLGTLLCQGDVGDNSPIKAQMNAPARTMSTRSTPASAPRPKAKEPHSFRAFRNYELASGYESPFQRARQGIKQWVQSRVQGRPTFPSTVARLSMMSVQAAMRGHFLGSKFAEDETRPKDVNDIVYFFDKNQEKRQFADFPRAKFRPGYVFLSEVDLVQLLYSTAATKPIITKVLGASSVAAAEKEILSHKGMLIKTLFYNPNTAARIDGYHRRVSLQDDIRRDTKYKLKGTVCTNGLVLNLLAYDTTTTRRRPKEGGQKSQEGERDLFDTQAEIDEEFELDEAFVEDEDEDQDESDTEMAGATSDDSEEDTEGGDGDVEMATEEDVDMGDEEDADMEWQPETDVAEGSSGRKRPLELSSRAQGKRPRIAHPHEGINWRRGSKILQNVEVAYEHAENCPRADRTIVIGMDPGEVATMTATRLDPARPSNRASVKVKRSFLYRPYIIFRRLLEQRKNAHGIDVLESQIPAFSRDGIHRYLDYMSQDGTRERLLSFYLCPWFLRKYWDCRKAQLAAYDFGIKAILRLVDRLAVHEARRREAWEPQVVFAIGLGSFDTQTGLPSKHSLLEKRFVSRVRSMGYSVYGVHEYYTSAKCPRTGCDAFLESVPKSRSRYCRGCQAYFDRDVVGSENIATICQAHIRQQRRPDKFKPTSH